MAKVAVRLPAALGAVTGGERLLQVEGATIREVLDALLDHRTELAVHLFDETGEFREHVLCFHNEENTRWLAGLDVPVADGDTLTILQAVSGGLA